MVRTKSKLYNTIWRWHFYAGLFVAPFVIILAITGGIYLFQNELDAWIYKDLYNIPASQAEKISADEQLAIAMETAAGAKPLAYIPPSDDTKAALIRLQTQDWRQLIISIDPYTGKVLGTIDNNKRFVQIVRDIHGKLLSGKTGQVIMELAASWAMVLLVTGLYLWWPRDKAAIFGTVLPRLKARGRIFWKDLHSITGFWISFILIFLILTGLPWSIMAGKVINFAESHIGKGVPQTGLGWDGGGSTVVKSENQDWAIDHAEHMAGKAHSNQKLNSTPIKISKVLDIAYSMKGIKPPFEIRLPVNEQGVYSIVVNHKYKLADTAYIHLDQYNGKVISQSKWQDFSTLSKGIALGVSLHEGQNFGFANQLINLTACIGLILMVVAGIMMWWQRRPAGELGAPKVMNKPKLGFGIIVIAVLLGIIMPLVGISMIAIIIIELLIGLICNEKATS